MRASVLHEIQLQGAITAPQDIVEWYRSPFFNYYRTVPCVRYYPILSVLLLFCIVHNCRGDLIGISS